MTDVLLFAKIVRPDGTTEARFARLPSDGACELRLRFFEGHFAKALLLRGMRLAAASPAEPPQADAVRAAQAAGPSNNNEH